MKELRKLAEAAKAHGGSWFVPVDLRQILGKGPATKDDAAYIAAASPDVVLRLLDVVEKAQAVASHAPRSSAQIDADWDALRTALSSLEKTNGL